MSEVGIWYCRSCENEFDIEDPNIKVIRPPSDHHSLIIDDRGRAHSLTYTTWGNIQRRRALNESTLQPNPKNQVRMGRELDEVLGEDETTPQEASPLDALLESLGLGEKDGER
jgi:YD repeat-containing protein